MKSSSVSGVWLRPLLPSLFRVGSATIGEVLAALAEVLYGSQFGLGALLSGFVQGLGSEFGFIVTKNRYESWPSNC